MPILNYTTEIAAEKSVGEIEKKLSRAKATAIMKEYDPTGILSAISFRIDTPHGVMAFSLPANIDKVFSVMKKDAKVPRRLMNKEQAARVGWRILKDWVEAQMALIETEMVTLSEVFLPYAKTNTGETFFKRFEAQGLPALTHLRDDK